MLRNRLHNPEDGRLLMMLSRASYALNPQRNFAFRDANEKYDVTDIGTAPCRDPPHGNLRVSRELQVEVLDVCILFMLAVKIFFAILKLKKRLMILMMFN